MKRIFSVLLISAMLLNITAFAANDITVLIDNQKIEFDVQPQLINDRTMVPMRKIFETLGAIVEWHERTEMIVSQREHLTIIMQIGVPSFSVTNSITGETKNIELDSPPIIVSDRTLVPARAISEALGYDVDWIDETQTVLITAPILTDEPSLNTDSENNYEF